MKALRYILLIALVTTGVFSAIVYSSCTKDRCNNVVCLHGGSCDGGSCTCLTGYEGIRCELLVRDRYVHNFNGGDTCSELGQYPLLFLAVPNKNLELNMKGILGHMNDSATCTMQSLDSFTFNGSNNGTTYRGYGIISNDSLWLTYHAQVDTINFDCTYHGIKY